MSNKEKGTTNPSKSHPQAVEFAIKFFSEAHGDMADQNSLGLDIFTPYTEDRKISLISDTKQCCNQGVKQIHALSVKTEDSENNVCRIHCKEFKPSETGPGNWWSIAMVEYETKEDACNAITKITKRQPNAPVALVSDIRVAAEGTPAAETINSMETLPARGQGLDCKLESLPRRFNLDRLMLIYDPSASFMNPGGMWGYPLLRRNNKQQQKGSDTQVFIPNE